MRALAGLLLLLAVPAAAQLPPPALPPAKPPTLLTLVVSAEVTRPPDAVRLSAAAVTTAASAVQALAENATRMTAVIAALKAAGIAERDVQTSGLSVSPQYKYVPDQAPVLTGYQARNQVTLTSRKLAEAGRMVDALVKAGANDLQGPEFLLSAPDAAQDEARAAAVAKGRARAELYARAAGMKLRRITSISEGVTEAPGPMQPMIRSMAIEADAKTPMQPGQLQLSVQLTMGFELEP